MEVNGKNIEPTAANDRPALLDEIERLQTLIDRFAKADIEWSTATAHGGPLRDADILNRWKEAHAALLAAAEKGQA